MERPELEDENIETWEAFWLLCVSRPAGMEPGAIPLTEIIAYWRDIARVTDPDVLGEKTRLIRAMDVVWLKEQKNGV